mmetsp:Transcript_16397/g.39344  ORF Transcript_16397/g.39344 Transcript_16397/m.39344 type:complete len:202 (+) Transcript_16397:1941-2546(+)
MIASSRHPRACSLGSMLPIWSILSTPCCAASFHLSSGVSSCVLSAPRKGPSCLSPCSWMTHTAMMLFWSTTRGGGLATDCFCSWSNILGSIVSLLPMSHLKRFLSSSQPSTWRNWSASWMPLSWRELAVAAWPNRGSSSLRCLMRSVGSIRVSEIMVRRVRSSPRLGAPVTRHTAGGMTHSRRPRRHTSMGGTLPGGRSMS